MIWAATPISAMSPSWGSGLIDGIDSVDQRTVPNLAIEGYLCLQTLLK